MDKIKIFCFLIMIEIISSLLSNQISESKKEEFEHCQNLRSTQCLNYKMKSKGFQCCYQNLKYIIEGTPLEDPGCEVTLNPVSLAQDEVKTENGKSMIKEFYGFHFFVMENRTENASFEYEYHCSDGNYTFGYASQDYSEEQKKIFKSINYCLRPLINEYRPPEITQETCTNSQLATTGNTGISCGYYEMKLYYNDSTVGDYKSCFLFNEDTLKNKNAGALFKQNSEYYSKLEAGRAKKELSYYQITITNPKGRYFKYNSLDDTVTVDNNTDSAKFLDYRYILIFILILI